MRHRPAPLPLALPLALLANLAVAAVALAGGWAQVAVTGMPVDPPAGAETTIELRVLQHGETAVSWPALTVVATDAASGTVIRAAARAEGPTGSYLATLRFPTAGAWTLTFDSTDLEMSGIAEVRVAPPVAPPVAPGSAASTADATPMALAALLIIALLAAAALGLRGRRAMRRDAPVSAGG